MLICPSVCAGYQFWMNVGGAPLHAGFTKPGINLKSSGWDYWRRAHYWIVLRCLGRVKLTEWLILTDMLRIFIVKYISNMSSMTCQLLYFTFCYAGHTWALQDQNWQKYEARQHAKATSFHFCNTFYFCDWKWAKNRGISCLVFPPLGNGDTTSQSHYLTTTHTQSYPSTPLRNEVDFECGGEGGGGTPFWLVSFVQHKFQQILEYP